MRFFILPLRLVSDANHHLPVLSLSFFLLFFPFFFTSSHISVAYRAKKSRKDIIQRHDKPAVRFLLVFFFSFVYLILFSFVFFFTLLSTSLSATCYSSQRKRKQPPLSKLAENSIRRTDDEHANRFITIQLIFFVGKNLVQPIDISSHSNLIRKTNLNERINNSSINVCFSHKTHA